MPHHVIIFDPPMCCSSGLCGPDPDQKLMELDQKLSQLKKQDVEVERFVITQSPEKFKEHPQIIKMIQEQQLKVLPITMVDGEILKTSSYPTTNEWQSWLGVVINMPKKEVTNE